MEKGKVKWIGNLYGTHKGRAVYYPYGGGIATITSTDYKHNKMIVICTKG